LAKINAQRNIQAKNETDLPIRVFVWVVRVCVRVCVRVRAFDPRHLKAFRHRVTGFEIVPLAVKIHSSLQHPFPMFSMGPTQPPIQWVPGLSRG